MTSSLNLLIFLFGSGLTFFIGVGCVLGALIALSIIERAWVRVLASLTVIIGLVLIVFSGTPLPNWLYGIAGAATMVWLIAERSNRFSKWYWRIGLRIIVVLCWATAVGLEIPYLMLPTITAHPSKVVIIGDSLSAGSGPRDEDTWPLMMKRAHGIDVLVFARVGATASSALKQAQQLPAGRALVIIEIGGNDLLGSTSAEEFAADLDQLLGEIVSPERVAVMFELPLPPFHNEFGRIQRALAAKHGVGLIPKHVLASVLSESGATVDSLHFSEYGHGKMADAVWRIIGRKTAD